ncbi:MAG TPA: hypothetical protein VFD48_15340, partial [Pyrinomonadaceae bacterium]|nr:hypothetical protein [Pyrinomonadaceae bacterium]
MSRPVMVRFAILALVLLSVLPTSIFAQGDLARSTTAVTYPLDESVEVKFQGTTLLPRLKGEAKVKRAG